MIIQVGRVNFEPTAAMALTTLSFEVYKVMIAAALLGLIDDGYDFSEVQNSSSSVLYQIRYKGRSAGRITFTQAKNTYHLGLGGVPHQVEAKVSKDLGKVIRIYLDRNNPKFLDWLEGEIIMDQPYIDALVNQALGAYKAGGDDGLKRWKEALPAPHLAEFERDCGERLQEAIEALGPTPDEVDVGLTGKEAKRFIDAVLDDDTQPTDIPFGGAQDVRKKHQRDRRRTKPL